MCYQISGHGLCLGVDYQLRTSAVAWLFLCDSLVGWGLSRRGSVARRHWLALVCTDRPTDRPTLPDHPPSRSVWRETLEEEAARVSGRMIARSPQFGVSRCVGSVDATSWTAKVAVNDDTNTLAPYLEKERMHLHNVGHLVYALG